MTETNKKTRDLRSYERTRAAFFIQRYESELRQAIAKTGHSQIADIAHDREIAIKVVDRLARIREEIMGAVAPYKKSLIKDIDGFAGEEIEAAMDFINEE